MAMDDRIVAVIGMRVEVFSPDMKQSWGKGTITRVVPFEIDLGDGKTEKLFEDYPEEITLDSGKKTEGMKCYWYPIEDASQQKGGER